MSEAGLMAHQDEEMHIMPEHDGTERPLACDLAALDRTERDRRQALADRLTEATDERLEEPDGYAFRYPSAALPVVAEFIALERRCCPFFHFTLDVTPDGGPVWLSITGRAGVKAFIAAELGLGLAGSGER